MKPKCLFIVGIALVTLWSACQEKDLYDPTKVEEIKEKTYAEKFTAKFGAVPAGYSWDASSGKAYWTETMTRATSLNEIDIPISEEYMQIEDNIFNYMNEQLKEKTNNSQKGRPFVMVVPDNEFYIVPIYQGDSGSKFDLYLEIDGVGQRKIWSKGESMKLLTRTYTRENTGEEWRAQDTWVAANSSTKMGTSTVTYYDANNQKVTDENEALRKEVTNQGVQSLVYTLDLTEYAGKIMTFFLKITEGSSDYSTTGDIHSSTDKFMVDLHNCPTPTNLEEGTKVMIIGAEAANDWNGHKSDWDMNEIVFMVYGKPYAPEVIEVKNDKIDQRIAKRYMFEDLGSTDDFDFNDVVVDFYDILTYTRLYSNGLLTSEKLSGHRQEAVIRHLGGTLPFALNVGGESVYSGGGSSTFNSNPGTVIDLGQQPDNSANEGYEGLPWKPSENNVSLTVNGGSSSGTYTVEFPGKGSIPMAIATDTNVEWMAERASITPEWFESIKPNN